jgi:pyrimidine operon attenuation protein/uracil phosphoribosyltransferase
MPIVLNEDEIRRAVKRIAHEILERNSGATNLLLLGIPTRGADLSYRIAEQISEIEGSEVLHGRLDITLYRDDLRSRAPKALLPTDIPLTGINGKDVVIVDDVLYSGRTVRAALDALTDIGRARTVQLAVLVDRGHREFPIRADYVGKNIPTNRDEVVRVLLQESDGVDQVVIES